MMRNDLTIAIPAYNNPECLQRALQSIARQTLRPLHVIVFDDCSPNSLEKTVTDFANLCDAGIHVEYVRFRSNMKIDAFYEIYARVKSEWMLQMHHDDELLDPNFLADWARLAQENANLVIVYANAIVEDLESPMFPIRDTSWEVVDGRNFVRGVLVDDPTAWSSLVYRVDLLKKHAWPQPPMFLDNALHERTGLDRDEGFNSLYLLAHEGLIARTDAVVAMRGTPKSAYSRSHHWLTPGNSLYVLYTAARSYLLDLGNYELAELVGKARLWYGIPLQEGWRFSAVRDALNHVNLSLVHYTWVRIATLLGINQLLLRQFLKHLPASSPTVTIKWGDELRHALVTTRGTITWYFVHFRRLFSRRSENSDH